MNYSDIRIVTSINGFNKLKEYINNNIKEHSENKQLINILDNIDLKYESNKQCYFGWNGYNWDEYFNKNVELIMDGLKELENNNYSYRFYRLGEDKEDYEEQHFNSTIESEKNLEYPNITREFDDRHMCDILYMEKSNAMINKEDYEYE